MTCFNYGRLRKKIARTADTVGFSVYHDEYELVFAFFGGSYMVIDQIFQALKKSHVISDYVIASDIRPRRIGRRTVEISSPNLELASVAVMVDIITQRLANSPNIKKVTYYKNFDKFLNL